MTTRLITTASRWLKDSRRRAAPPANTMQQILLAMPANMRLYVIGDIHGCAKLLAQLYEQFAWIDAQRPVERTAEIVLGDFIDRGADSKKVIDMLIRRSEHRTVVALRGNHEQLMLDTLQSPQRLPIWLRLGGLETLRSYGIVPSVPLDANNLIDTIRRANAAIPKKHLDFLGNLRTIVRIGDLTFVHAGLRPGTPIDQQLELDLMQIREPFLSHPDMFEGYVVHGHTPVEKADIRPNRLNLDTGAYATGLLSAAVIEQGRIEIIEARIQKAQ